MLSGAWTVPGQVRSKSATTMPNQCRSVRTNLKIKVEGYVREEGKNRDYSRKVMIYEYLWRKKK